MVFRFHSTRVGIALYFNNYCMNKTGTKKKDNLHNDFVV